METIWKFSPNVGEGMPHPFDQEKENWSQATQLVGQLLGFFGSIFAEKFADLAVDRKITNFAKFGRLVKAARKATAVAGDGIENPGMLEAVLPLALVSSPLREKLGRYWVPSWYYQSHSGKTTLLVGWHDSELSIVLLMEDCSSFLDAEGEGQQSLAEKAKMLCSECLLS